MEDHLELFELYFKKSKEYYLDKLDRYQKGEKFAFNIYAFLFGLFWFIYRKMYKQAFLIIGLVICESLFEKLILPKDISASSQSAINTISTMIIAFITGSLGNYLYITKAIKVVNTAQQIHNEDVDSIKKIIAKKGGVSYSFLIIIALIIAAIIAINNYN